MTAFLDGVPLPAWIVLAIVLMFFVWPVYAIWVLTGSVHWRFWDREEDLAPTMVLTYDTGTLMFVWTERATTIYVYDSRDDWREDAAPIDVVSARDAAGRPLPYRWRDLRDFARQFECGDERVAQDA